MNDSENLYIAISIADTRHLMTAASAGFVFDSYDALVVSASGGSSAAFFDDVYLGSYSYFDVAIGGTSNGRGAATWVPAGGLLAMELAHPLRSGDRYDFSLAPGSTIQNIVVMVRVFREDGTIADTYLPAPLSVRIR
jgi:hypothetical protein